ncbi:MAG: M23 family metallopeptidase, partial [Candidatus Syntrophosphaera sp.]
QEPTSRHIFRARGDSLAYFLEQLPVQTRQRIIRGELQGTLDASLLALGLSPMEKQQINNGLEADINFAMDAKNGDEFKIFLEERIFEGNKLPGSKIFYVSYTGKNTGLHELFRYEGPEEKSVLNGLYTTEGKSNCATGVGYPLASIHVVSRFGRRIDPFHRTWRMHQGVDYRAGYGTPVYAVASGTVTASRYAGGWGNEIRIRHNSGMITQYAHLSRRNVRRGQKVVRGQVIGRVGSTGRSTGSHLHFGLMSSGRWINPTNLRMVGATKLKGDRLAEFKRQMQAIREMMSAFEAIS